jgi:nitrogen regulatory protein PII-like uncharacterized protein
MVESIEGKKDRMATDVESTLQLPNYEDVLERIVMIVVVVEEEEVCRVVSSLCIKWLSSVFSRASQDIRRDLREAIV